MKIGVLAATMNQADPMKIAGDIGIKDGVIVNQITSSELECPPTLEQGGVTALSVRSKGLSKSRNMALRTSTADVCLLADDDVRLDAQYYQTIERAYAQFPGADIIALYIEDEDQAALRVKKPLKEGKVGKIGSMKIRSVQISFRRDRIVEAGITFREQFGAGTEFFMGEENIFLADCLRHGLKIYSYPIKIGSLVDRESSWFKGFNEQYLRVKGVVFRAISPVAWPVLVLQFVLRKYKLFEVGMAQALNIMLVAAAKTNPAIMKNKGNEE